MVVEVVGVEGRDEGGGAPMIRILTLRLRLKIRR
jgi:hypothetical protein